MYFTFERRSRSQQRMPTRKDPVVTRVGEQCNVNSVENQRASNKGGLGVLRQAKGEVRNNVDWLLGHRRARYNPKIVYKG